jgi:hypothetical protein
VLGLQADTLEREKMNSIPVQFVVADLIFLRDAGVVIDEETFVSVLHFENTHRNFAQCSGCGAVTFSQHDPLCRYASVLFLPDWFEIIQSREDR